MNDENGYVPDIIDNDGKIISANIFFSKEIADYIRPFITAELDKELLHKLKNILPLQ